MPCQYATNTNQGTVTSSYKTAGILTSIAGLRPRIIGWMIGADGAPNSTDCSMVWQLQLSSAAGTTTAVTPTPLDVAYGAAGGIGGSNATIEPTYTAGKIPWVGPLNQRASQQLWLPTNAPIVLVGTAANGAGMQVLSTNYGGKADCVIYHEE